MERSYTSIIPTLIGGLGWFWSNHGAESRWVSGYLEDAQRSESGGGSWLGSLF